MTRQQIIANAEKMRDQIAKCFGIHSQSAAAVRLLLAKLEREKDLFDAQEAAESESDKEEHRAVWAGVQAAQARAMRNERGTGNGI